MAVAVYEPFVGSVIREDDLPRVGAAIRQTAEVAADCRLADAARIFARAVATDDEITALEASDFFEHNSRYVPVLLRNLEELMAYEGPQPDDPSELDKITAPVLFLRGQRTPHSTFFADSEQHVAQQPDAPLRGGESGGSNLRRVTQPPRVIYARWGFVHDGLAVPAVKEADMAIQHLELHDVMLEVHDLGSGEPVVFIQTALIADELLPLASEPPLADGFRGVVYHRRGYAGSSPVDGLGSIPRDAADCRALLAALRIERAHVVGLSYSGAVALQLAADAPECLRSLVLIEPPPVHIPSAGEFRQVNEDLLTTRRTRGAAAALDDLLAMVIGPHWRKEIEHDVPGASEQMERDVLTFFDTDLPALLTWQFDHDDAERITCPVLHVGGSDTHRWFLEVRELVGTWLPHAEDIQIEGAGHSLALTHTPHVAQAMADFLHRVSHEAPSP